MKTLFRASIVAVTLFAAALSTAHASTSAPVAGKEYTVLSTPQPVDAPGKIVVTEFMWYGCPHCAEFDPYLEAWVKKQGPDVVFQRVPVAFRDDFVPHSRMFHALDALGLASRLTPVVFNEIYVKKDYLLTPDSQAAFLATQGVDKAKYLQAYNSFSTQSALQRDTRLIKDYQVNATPTLAVQGKYLTGPASTESLPGTIQVLDYLVASVRAKKL
ncbi:thiol:disulfide interchange protein DsbA/DsbL [Paraburkholderia sp. BL21I4N1]|uniref:thiol:disulfide interchange protein DsbA/DsbL n=1 Tax=Paraburkholderia sp. BL21I4N1 TaxID=1938801 RepID=UPI000CFDB43C|nr:thiol:disulfide interchange protein DsbA/DsbL [Paraburkholderia sp. BL21I4N1]PQV46658.1 thiol:disulfide interchange protein DsbA [Paraburkholderia sp. BL21I4N1]